MCWISHVISHSRWRLRNGCRNLKLIIMCTKLLLAGTWHSDKVGNGSPLCTVKCNWVIVAGPHSSLRERVNSNNQSIIMKPGAKWVTLWVPEDETDTETQIHTALEWESGWAIMVNWKPALWTIASCKRIQNAITLYHLHTYSRKIQPTFKAQAKSKCVRCFLL